MPPLLFSLFWDERVRLPEGFAGRGCPGVPGFRLSLPPYEGCYKNVLLGPSEQDYGDEPTWFRRSIEHHSTEIGTPGPSSVLNNIALIRFYAVGDAHCVAHVYLGHDELAAEGGHLLQRLV